MFHQVLDILVSIPILIAIMYFISSKVDYLRGEQRIYFF